MKASTLRTINDCGIIAILRGFSVEEVLHLGQALLEGGVGCMEITYPAAKDPTVTADSIRALCRELGPQMCVGAGTVLTPEQVYLTKECGGRYIISPNTDPAVIRATVEAGLVSIPGALTPSECQLAHQAGADYVKLFPMDAMGPAYLKALAAPLSHIRFLAVGGVNVENLGAFLRAGACGIGVGSNLGFREAVESGDYSIVRRRAEAYVAAIQAARQG